MSECFFCNTSFDDEDELVMHLHHHHGFSMEKARRTVALHEAIERDSREVIEDE